MLRIDMDLENAKAELALTVLLCILLVLAALLIADLIGAINVIG
jgi:hypothetical protein